MLATAALPSRSTSCSPLSICAWTCLSTAVSMRETNTEATEAMRSIGSPRAARSSSPSMYAVAAAS